MHRLRALSAGYQYGLGGMLAAIDRMKAGVLDRAYCFFSGGHHAHADWGHGYCLLNPQAAAVRYAQERGFAKSARDRLGHSSRRWHTIDLCNDPSVYCSASTACRSVHGDAAGAEGRHDNGGQGGGALQCTAA